MVLYNQTKIPRKSRTFKNKTKDNMVLWAYDFEDETSSKNVAFFIPEIYASEAWSAEWENNYVSYNFNEVDQYLNVTGKKLIDLIEKFDEEYEESRITHIEKFDEDEKLLTKNDWEKMLENLDMPREKYESRPVVCNDGLLCYNAATGCRVVGINSKRGDELYLAVEKKKKFKKQYWRYANKDEIIEQINLMND